jgi:hypothetical protein
VRHDVSSSCPQTPYFLITDSDTFFTNKWQALDLMSQRPCNASSGVCDLKKKVIFLPCACACWRCSQDHA